MADYDEDIPADEKVAIASDFVMNAPPGEFNEVFNDVRVLLNDDALLKEGAAEAFVNYNEESFTPAQLDDDSKVLITKHGRQSDGRYIDPKTKQVFKFDHLRKEVSDLEAAAGAGAHEELRAAVETEAETYVKDHYHTGTTSVYDTDAGIVVCVEDHKYQPRNFWNGRWRSEWTVSPDGQVIGKLYVHVHYYEDGNVQLRSSKEITDTIKVDDATSAAKALFKIVLAAENEYQTAISENYNTMSETTFKALRRALPITRSKVDWNKILSYKIGKELKK
ncbi:uncharacterized protein MONBRDRAFT_32113 [Monosiga brevicollis MX1]|uniref:F-actin-capping protein subunit alpha n=1 Tax=Monosiga brevicollis TaxID=81824 RepID=A9UXR2_MONBE|nr:uncharacterized protein MONBRDRAFT_32113 [Monosiga brevicollis MX1]EDQ89732.1 predicted protein [Monosiga brevicollis MX1]|eukprot:XP_001745154.1 hypothetical protein [Monosiga brevicollis MX1]